MSDGGEDHGQRVLLEIAQQLASTRDLSSLVPLVLERVVALLGAERGMFLLLDLDGQVERAVTHNLSWAGPPAPLPIARSILDRVIREREMLVASSVDDGAMRSTESMKRFGLRRVVAVPVLRRAAVLGVIYIDSAGQSGSVVHEQAEALRALASMIAVAVENARLFDELRYRRDLLAWMVHDLRNPITTIEVNASLLLEAATGEARAMLTEVETAAARSARMIDWALTLDRIDDSMPVYSPWSVSLSTLLERALAEHAALARRRGVRVVLALDDALPAAEVYLDRFSVVIDNLLFNALKFAEEGTEVVVSARPREDLGPTPGTPRERRGMRVFERVRTIVPDLGAGYIEVSVKNHGEPVSSDLRHRLFSRGAHGVKAHTKTPGGLGLAIAYDCARSLGGALWIASPEGARDTVFSFTVPASPAPPDA